MSSPSSNDKSRSASHSGFSSPSKQKSTKRLLSSSSNSPTTPSHLDKKKNFCSTNRYAILATEDDNVEPTVMSTNTVIDSGQHIPHEGKTNTNARAPPIYIKNTSIVNFSALKNTLIRLTSINGFYCKSTFSFLIIHPNGVSNFNAIVTHLASTDACYHTFAPPPHRPYRVVIRNLHHTTLITDISEALGDLGFSVRRVENVLKNGHPLPLFFVDLIPNDNSHEILKLSSLLNTIIKVEKRNKTKNGPPQCHICQDYGHTKNYCGHDPRCVKCGENHDTEDCSKDKNSPPKCALCQGAHTANFKGCPVFKSLSKRPRGNRKTPTIAPATTVLGSFPKLRTKSKSYAEAVKSDISPTETISSVLSNFINNLNLLISPLISLLTEVMLKRSSP